MIRNNKVIAPLQTPHVNMDFIKELIRTCRTVEASRLLAASGMPMEQVLRTVRRHQIYLRFQRSLWEDR